MMWLSEFLRDLTLIIQEQGDMKVEVVAESATQPNRETIEVIGSTVFIKAFE